jgi:hypothetical protein
MNADKQSCDINLKQINANSNPLTPPIILSVSLYKDPKKAPSKSINKGKPYKSSSILEGRGLSIFFAPNIEAKQP